MRLSDLLDEVTLKKVGTRQACRLIGGLVRQCPEAAGLTQQQGTALTTALSVLEKMETLTGYDEHIIFARVIALRKLGRREEC